MSHVLRGAIIMGKIEYYSNVDLRKNEIQNVVVEVATSDPVSATSTKQGQIVSFEGNLYIAKTAQGTSPETYGYVMLAQGGDVSGLTTRVGNLETAVGSNTTGSETGLYADIAGLTSGKVSKLSEKPTAGTYTKVAINAEGQVTAGSNIIKSDITALLDADDGTYLAKTGTATKATVLETGRTIAISGGTTAGTATSFDGSANISIPITALDASKLVVGSDSAKAPIAVMPTGNAASKLLELGATVGTGAAVIWDGSKFVGRDITGVYDFKGSCTTAELPAQPSKGEVWNLTDAGTYGPAGTNVAWTGSAWDALGFTLSTAGFEETSNKVASATFNPTSGTYTGDDTHYPTTLAMQTALGKKLNANAAITGATKCKITYDANGLVTSGADLQASDIPTIQQSQVDGLSTALSGKQATITGAATTIASNDLTADLVLVSNSSGKVAASEITATELGYLDGVTSAIQTQINGKVAANEAITASGDNWKIVKYDTKGLVTAGKAIEAGDVPSLSADKITSGTFNVARIPDITASKVTDFAATVNSQMAAQFVETALSSATKDASLDKYTITTTTKAYGVMLLNKDNVQVFAKTTVTGTSIIIEFDESITATDFTVSYILKNATS